MNYPMTWTPDPLKILTRRESAAVLADLKKRGERSAPARFNLTLVRLACCCGLRVSELAALRLADVVVDQTRPRIVVRAEIAKGGKARYVPLWWDAGTLCDLKEWKQARKEAGAREGDLFLVSRSQSVPQSRHTLRRRFRTACKALGLVRIESLTIHHGRHTFISHALAGGRTLA